MGIAISPLAIFNLIYLIEFYLQHIQIDDISTEGSCFYDKDARNIIEFTLDYDGSKEVLNFLRKNQEIIDVRGSYSAMIIQNLLIYGVLNLFTLPVFLILICVDCFYFANSFFRMIKDYYYSVLGGTYLRIVVNLPILLLIFPFLVLEFV